MWALPILFLSVFGLGATHDDHDRERCRSSFMAAMNQCPHVVELCDDDTQCGQYLRDVEEFCTDETYHDEAGNVTKKYTDDAASMRSMCSDPCMSTFMQLNHDCFDDKDDEFNAEWCSERCMLLMGDVQNHCDDGTTIEGDDGQQTSITDMVKAITGECDRRSSSCAAAMAGTSNCTEDDFCMEGSHCQAALPTFMADCTHEEIYLESIGMNMSLSDYAHFAMPRCKSECFEGLFRWAFLCGGGDIEFEEIMDRDMACHPQCMMGLMELAEHCMYEAFPDENDGNTTGPSEPMPTIGQVAMHLGGQCKEWGRGCAAIASGDAIRLGAAHCPNDDYHMMGGHDHEDEKM